MIRHRPLRIRRTPTAFVWIRDGSDVKITVKIINSFVLKCAL